MEFGKLSRAIHTTKADYNGNEFTLRFRGISLKLQDELRSIGGIDDVSDAIKLPEYLTVFVVSLTSGEDTYTPTIDEWKAADIRFQQVIFDAIQEAMNPGKSTPNLSKDSSSAETSAASISTT